MRDQKESLEIHSFIKLGQIPEYGYQIGWVMPFVIKAYTFGLSIDQISQLCNILESLVLRNELAKANVKTKFLKEIGWLFEGFYTEDKDEWIDVERIIEHINWMKKEKGRGFYWSNEKLYKHLQGKMDASIVRFLLWKYENHLLKSGQKDYELMRFDEIEDPQREHIAPKTENAEAGYPKYTEEFKEKYLDCLGNSLLMEHSLNISIGNKPFAKKLKIYDGPDSLAHHREVVEMVGDTPKPKWTKELIEQRKEKIIQFILNEF